LKKPFISLESAGIYLSTSRFEQHDNVHVPVAQKKTPMKTHRSRCCTCPLLSVPSTPNCLKVILNIVLVVILKWVCVLFLLYELFFVFLFFQIRFFFSGFNFNGSRRFIHVWWISVWALLPLDNQHDYFKLFLNPLSGAFFKTHCYMLVGFQEVML
jgi:hypothetical protein